MELATKRSFAEMREHTQAMKSNSDLENLSSALDQIALEKQELKKQYEAAIKELEEQEAKINDAAAQIEAGEVYDVGTIKELYFGARGKSGKYL